MSRPIGDSKLLEKRIPRSAKWSNVRGRVDTGASMSKHLAKVEDIQNNFRIQKGELFKRLKLSTFAALVLEVDKVNMMNESEENDDDVEDDIVERVETTPRQSKFLDVIRGTGELNMREQNKNLELPPKPKLPKEQTPYSQSPYLLVDVRDSDAYEQCHMITAESYPSTNFSRTMNPFSHQMLQFKNMEGHIIILYDTDELIATECATTMAQRGFENVFVLSGGLRVLAQKLPNGLITGSLPAEAFQSLDAKSKLKSGKVKYNPKNKVPADMSLKRFTHDHLGVLSESLDNLLMAPSDAGSRLSKSKIDTRSRSRASMLTTTSSNSNIKPWK